MSELIRLMSNDGSTKSKLREWSSLIGIITAIVGNILISFALNIQRYAHIRLKRERTGGKSPWLKRKKKLQNSGYGTQQSDIAEERARLNLAAPFLDRRESNKPTTTVTGDDPTAEERGESREHAFSLHSRRSSQSQDEGDEKDFQESEQKSYLKSPYWWLGLVFMTIGEAGNFLAYGFAPASTVSPLGVVALISNCIIAPCLLKEQFRQRDFWGVVIAIAGAVIIVFSANNSETRMGPGDIWSAITRWEFETYLGITAGLIIVLMWASGRYGDRTILIDLGLVGLFGGYTALTTKGIASLLSDTLWRTLTFPVTYLLLFILIATALMQIRYVNRALQRFDSTQVIPTQFVLFTISVIVGSAVLYRDFNSATGDRIGKFVGGCLLTFLGVYLITSGRRRQSPYEVEGTTEDVGGPIRLVDEERYQDDIEETRKSSHSRKLSNSAAFDVVDGASSRRSSQHQKDIQFSPTRPSRSSRQSSAVSPTSPPTEDQHLLANPWRSADDLDVHRPTTLEGTTSSPILPSEAHRQLPSTPPDHGSSERPSLVHTPTLPETPTQPTRSSTLSRRSIAHLTPGPYMSPLSSSLSAVVADSIRRGKGSPARSQRPRLSGLRKSISHRASGGSIDDTPTASTPLEGSQLQRTGTEGEQSGIARSRSRSLSTTLGEFFKLKRERSKGKQSQSPQVDDES